jgi:hypothetical protein
MEAVGFTAVGEEGDEEGGGDSEEPVRVSDAVLIAA